MSNKFRFSERFMKEDFMNHYKNNKDGREVLKLLAMINLQQGKSAPEIGITIRKSSQYNKRMVQAI